MSSLRLWISVCTGLILPISCLRAIDSMALYMTGSDIGLVYLVETAASLGFALLACAAVQMLSKVCLAVLPVQAQFIGRSLHWVAVGAVLGLALIAPVQLWTRRVFGLPGLSPALASCLLAVLVVVWTAHAGRRIGIAELSTRLRGALERLAIRASYIGVGSLVLALASVGLGRSSLEPLPDRSLGAGATKGALNVILITLDTFSASHAELYGHERATTPQLSAFAREAVVFERFYAACNFTTCSVASMHTGVDPWVHRVFTLQGYIRDEMRTSSLAAILRSHGYQTAAFGSNWNASPTHLMIDDAYDALEDFPPAVHLRSRRLFALPGSDLERVFPLFPFNFVEHTVARLFVRRPVQYPFPSAPVYARARRFLSERDPARPFFLWVHTMAPHEPYLPPAPFRGRFLDSKDRVSEESQRISPEVLQRFHSRYDELLLYADSELGAFISFLRESRFLEDSLVIVTSDHGESFERGQLGHGGPRVYENLMRVPLLIRAPGVVPRRVADPAGHVDLLPTVVDFAQIPDAVRTDGRSLRDVVEGRAVAARPIFSVNFERSSSFRSLERGTVAVVDWPWKYIKYIDPLGATNELFDLREDPDEKENLITRRAADAERLDTVIRERLWPGEARLR